MQDIWLSIFSSSNDISLSLIWCFKQPQLDTSLGLKRWRESLSPSVFDLLSWSRYGSLFWINPSDDSCCEPNKVLGMVHHWIHVLVFICKEDHLKTHMNGGCSFRIVTGNHTVSICCSWLSDSKKSTAGNVPAVCLLIPGAQSMMPLGKRSRGGCLVEVWPAWPSQRILMWFPIESSWTQGVIELVQQPHICSSESSWRSMCFQECWPIEWCLLSFP